MQLPQADPDRLDKRAQVVKSLHKVLPKDAVLSTEDDMLAFQCDALAAYRQTPMVVVLPRNTAQVSQVMKVLHQQRIPVVPWGAGTGLSGGALPMGDGVTIALSRMKRIVEIDLENRCATVEPGVTNLAISQAVAHHGLYYAPDPSSQIACSIGGNVAENSGGVHCLKYGVTTNNLLALEVVTAEGEVLRVGGKMLDDNGFDLMGILTGSEGLLGIITQVVVRLLPKPLLARAILAAFESVEEAGSAVGAVISAGMIPAGMEIMDHFSIQATESFAKAGYPMDAQAILLVELDGHPLEVEQQIEEASTILKQAGASSMRVSTSEDERLRLWKGRKAAFPAMARISPDYYCIDGSIPRRTLAAALRGIEALSKKYGLRVANVFHAGDGNLHPLVLYNEGKGELERAEALGEEILKLCVDLGGVLSGEHGIGIEKKSLMDYQFDQVDLDAMQRVKCSFDVHGLLNPGKVFPVLRRCAEGGRMHVHKGQLPRPDLEHF